MPRLRRPGTPSSRRSCRARAPRARRPRAAPDGGAARSPLGDLGEADVPRLPTGIGELDRVLGGGIVPGLARPARRRAGHRQVDAPAPGRGGRRGGRRRAGRPVRDRRGIGRPAPAAGGPPRPAERAGRRARSRSSPTSEVGRDHRGRPGRAARPSSSSTRSRRRRSTSSTAPAGSVGQVRESALRLMELAKGEGIAVVLVGHVTKDGSIAGPRDAGAPRRRGARPRGRALRGAAPAPRHQEPLRLDRRARRPRDGRGRAARGRRSRPGVPRRARRRRARAASSPRRWRAAGRSSSRSRRWSRRPATARRRGAPAGIDPNRLALLLAVLGRRAGIGLGQPRRLREPRRRPERRRAGPRPAVALALASSLRDRPIDAAAPSRSARSGCWASCGRSPASIGACARRHGSASTRAIVPAAAAAATRRAGIEVVPVANLRDALAAALGDGRSRPRSAPPDRGTWRCGAGDAEADAASARLRPRRSAATATTGDRSWPIAPIEAVDPNHPLPGSRTRRARSGSSLVIAQLAVFQPAPGSALLVIAWVVAWIVAGLHAAAVPDGHPGAGRAARVQQLSTAEFVTAIIGLFLGPAAGPAARPAAVRPARADRHRRSRLASRSSSGWPWSA